MCPTREGKKGQQSQVGDVDWGLRDIGSGKNWPVLNDSSQAGVDTRESLHDKQFSAS